jgi:hypothetical protein
MLKVSFTEVEYILVFTGVEYILENSVRESVVVCDELMKVSFLLRLQAEIIIVNKISV